MKGFRSQIANIELNKNFSLNYDFALDQNYQDLNLMKLEPL